MYCIVERVLVRTIKIRRRCHDNIERIVAWDILKHITLDCRKRCTLSLKVMFGILHGSRVDVCRHPARAQTSSCYSQYTTASGHVEHA